MARRSRQIDLDCDCDMYGVDGLLGDRKDLCARIINCKS